MPITLDADIAWPIDGDGQTRPIWRVQCDHGGPGDRLLLVAEGADDAGRRAVDEYGWTVNDGRVTCRSHRHG